LPSAFFLALAVVLPVVVFALWVLTMLVWWAVVQVHFENNSPFAVVEQLEREIEVSHWGNVYVTEHYKMCNAGAKHKGTFSRSAPRPSQLPSCWENGAHSQGGNAHDNVPTFVRIANQTNIGNSVSPKNDHSNSLLKGHPTVFP
jgi:hypothetical protein